MNTTEQEVISSRVISEKNLPAAVVILGMVREVTAKVEQTDRPIPHPAADPDSKDISPKALDNEEVRKTVAVLESAFANKIRINNILCILEKINFLRVRGGFVIEALVRCPDGEVVEVPFRPGKEYSPAYISKHIAQCILSSSVRKSLVGGMRINREFINAYTYRIKEVPEGNEVTLVLVRDQRFFEIVLPIQEKFTREEIVREVAIQLM